MVISSNLSCAPRNGDGEGRGGNGNDGGGPPSRWA